MGGEEERRRERSRRNDVAHGCPGSGREGARSAEGQGGTRHRAAPFSRGSPDVTVALFNYSHAYARRCAPGESGSRRDAQPTMSSSSSSSTRASATHTDQGIRLTRRIMFCVSALPQGAQITRARGSGRNPASRRGRRVRSRSELHSNPPRASPRSSPVGESLKG